MITTSCDTCGNRNGYLHPLTEKYEQPFIKDVCSCCLESAEKLRSDLRKKHFEEEEQQVKDLLLAKREHYFGKKQLLSKRKNGGSFGNLKPFRNNLLNGFFLYKPKTQNPKLKNPPKKSTAFPLLDKTVQQYRSIFKL